MVENYSEEIKELVIQRLKAMPRDIKLAFGNNNLILSISDMVKSIRNNEKIGNEIIKMHLDYLKSIKNKVA